MHRMSRKNQLIHWDVHHCRLLHKNFSDVHHVKSRNSENYPINLFLFVLLYYELIPSALPCLAMVKATTTIETRRRQGVFEKQS